MSDVRKYREALGSVIYLSKYTRPDLSYVMSKLAQYFANHTTEQWNAVKDVFRFLKGTPNKELCFKKGACENLMPIGQLMYHIEEVLQVTA